VTTSQSNDGERSPRRIIVVGLDCAAPELVFEAWRDDLPTLGRLMREGVWGRLESTIPAITVPAWSAMMTGKDPGQLGFYGFRNRKDHSYDGLAMANARSVRQPRLWHVLSDAGLRVGAIGVPQTYPVAPVNGHMVSCFLTPNARSEFTYPPELKAEISGWIDGDEFLVDVPNFRSDDKDRILADIYRMADQHFTVCERLLEREQYDFFMTVDMGVDRIHHAFWKYMDPKHPKHEPGNRFQSAIHDYYVHIDRRVGRLLELAGEDVTTFVVSDHGAKAMLGGICINEWLIEHGWLVLEETPEKPTPLERCKVDWSRTKAWGEGGYYGRLFFNVAGREPEGVIAPEDYEAERSRLVAELSELTDHEGKPLRVDAYKPEEVYAEVTNVAPDLILYFGELDWRSVGSVGIGSVWTFENDTGPDDANHAQHGIFILHDPSAPGGGEELEGLRLYDVTPTILSMLDLPVPEGIRGEVIAR